MIQALIEAARQVIAEQLADADSPAVLWSSGEDSQLLLWLVREQMPDVQVIHFRSLPSDTKHAFADQIMNEWQLNMLGLPRVGVDVVANGDEVNLVEEYAVSPEFSLYLPMENEPGRPVDRDSACGISVLNQKRDGTRRAERRVADVVFIGHHTGDGDLVLGPLEPADVIAQAADVRMVYALKDWTKDDVREVSRLLGVPQNDARYAGDLSANPDYYLLCTDCLKPGRTEDFIECPRLKVPVYNLGKLIQPEGRRQAWRERFINIGASNVTARF